MHVHACTRAHTHTHTHTLTQNPTNKPHKTKPAGSKTHSSNTSPPKKGGRLEQNPWRSALDLNDRLWACGKEQPKQRNSQSKGASLSGLYAFKRRLWGLKASLRTDSNDGLPGTVMQGGILACAEAPSHFSQNTHEGGNLLHLLLKLIKIISYHFRKLLRWNPWDPNGASFLGRIAKNS